MIASTLRRAICAAAIAAGFTAAAPAFAQENTGLYLQGGYSYLNFKANDTNYEVDTHAITARLGWQFTPQLGLEGELTGGLDNGDFDFDSTEDDIDFDDNNDGDFTDIINLSGDLGLDFLAAAYGRYTVPLGDSLGLGLRVGYAYAEVDANAVTPGGQVITLAEDAEDGFSAGAGLEFSLARNIKIRADYTWFGFDEVDVDSGTIAVGITF
jgi:opacity protein-like surface antigen